MEKEKKTNKNKVKKTTKTSTKKPEVKKVVKKQKIEDKKKKTFWTSNNILKIVFALLLVLVIVLSILVFIQKDKTKTKANIVIPIVNKDDEFDFSINALALSKSDGYVFKITNYKGKKINKKDINYSITIENGTNSSIKVTKNNDKANLMMDQKNTIINEKLAKKEKEFNYYTVKTISSGKLEKDEIINIKIRVIE